MQPQESMLEVKNKKHKLYIGIPKEISFQENRIPLTPLSVALLVNNGHEVMLESNAGQAANFSDKDYSEQGAQIVYDTKNVYEADIIIKIAPPTLGEIDIWLSFKRMSKGPSGCALRLFNASRANPAVSPPSPMTAMVQRRASSGSDTLTQAIAMAAEIEVLLCPAP